MLARRPGWRLATFENRASQGRGEGRPRPKRRGWRDTPAPGRSRDPDRGGGPRSRGRQSLPAPRRARPRGVRRRSRRRGRARGRCARGKRSRTLRRSRSGREEESTFVGGATQSVPPDLSTCPRRIAEGCCAFILLWEERRRLRGGRDPEPPQPYDLTEPWRRRHTSGSRRRGRTRRCPADRDASQGALALRRGSI